MNSLKKSFKLHLLGLFLLMNAGLFGYCDESFSAETHTEYCQKLKEILDKKAEWDKKHPEGPYRSKEERRADVQRHRACSIDWVRQADRNEAGTPTPAASAASTPMKVSPPSAGARP